jgi:hypothetical protein
VNTTIQLQTPGDAQPRINCSLPNLLAKGFQLAWRNWPFVIWAYAVNLGFALLAGIPFATGLTSYLDHSLAAQRIAGTVDVTYLGELLLQLRRTSFISTAVHTAVWLNFLQLLILFFLFAGAIFVYVSAEPARLSVLLRGGVAYFWRFVRAAILAGCIAAVILGILLFARVLLLDRLSAVYVERTMFLYSSISGAVVLLVALVVRLWWDLVEVYIVRNAMDGERRVRQALRPALRLLGNYFFRIVGSFFLSGVAGIGALALCLLLWKQFIPAHQVWLACLLAQLGLFLLLASRFWQRGIEATLVLTSDPPIVAAEESAAMVEEEMPAPASPEVFAALSEPTLRELVQKLSHEPWGNPEVAALLPPRPSPVAPPVPAVDLPKLEEPQVSILDRHATKFPLGGMPPEKEAATTGEEAADPGKALATTGKETANPGKEIATTGKEGANSVEQESAPGDPEKPPRHRVPLP